MNGYGLAGLAKGFNEGFTSTISGLTALGKDKREAELFGLQKAKLQREEDAEVRKVKMQEQITTDMQALQEQINQNPEGMTETQINRARADIFQKARIDHKFMDEESWDKQRKINKQLKREGFEDAFNYFSETGDSDGAVSRYASAGKVKPPPGTFMKREVDETGMPDIVVYAPGPDGKPVRKTSQFEYMLASMPEEMIRYGTKMKETAMKEKGDTFRTGMTTAATLAAASMKGDKKLSPEVEAFHNKMNKEFESIFKGTGFNLNPREESVLRGEIGALGRQLIDAGKTSDEAYILATRAVFQKNKIPVDLSRIK